MPVRDIITGQKIKPPHIQRSRELRKQMTIAEKVLWQALCGNKLVGSHFRRQQIIAGYIVDFYCHQAGLVVEVDGPIHLQQKEYDTDRDQKLMEMGLRIVHITNEDVLENLSSVLKNIHGFLQGSKD